ncbi:Hypothetical Protein FCC1311_097792 [Hondaea fermentalgiana]|uniref:TIR domain-containing protein n=1 Tax=Hondaea fermentalgiana TaxID=2315210 RepID=A0A2R5GRP1_9STRA|nr:Hypothetical Protein FCC1311_097792 [Hondaea fermentalgiana]|eukprot:GBG33556.1 Hypothetical Protein FCC1311_097792 [Hondaea fermentalgiana]
MSVKWPTHDQFLDTDERVALARLGYAASWGAGNDNGVPTPLRKLEIDLQLALIAMRKRRKPKVPKTLDALAESYRGSTWAPVANEGTVEAIDTFLSRKGSRRSGVAPATKVRAAATLIGNYVGALVQGVQMSLIYGPKDIHPDHVGAENVPAVRAAAAIYRGFIMPYQPHSMAATSALLHQLGAGTRMFIQKEMETSGWNRKIGKFRAEDFSRRAPLFDEQEDLFRDILRAHELERVFPEGFFDDDVWLVPASKRSRNKIWFDVAVLPRLQSEFETLAYVGTFKNGKMHGRGLVFASNASRPLLIADFDEGTPHGKGFLILNNYVVTDLTFDHGTITKTKAREQKTHLMEFVYPVEVPKKPPTREKNLCERVHAVVIGEDPQAPEPILANPGEYTSPAAAATAAYTAAAVEYVKQTASSAVNFVWETVMGPPPPPPPPPVKKPKRWHVFLTARRDTFGSADFCKWLSRSLARKLDSAIFDVEYERSSEYDLEEMREVMETKDIFVPLLSDESFHDIPFWVEAVTAQHYGRKCVPVSMDNLFPPLRYRRTTYHDILGLFSLEDWIILDSMGVLPIDVMQTAEWILSAPMHVIKSRNPEHVQKIATQLQDLAGTDK